MTPTASRLALFELERRTNPSGISFTQGNLIVDGTPAADSIHVYFYGADPSRVAVVMQTGPATVSKIVPKPPNEVPNEATMGRLRGLSPRSTSGLMS